MSRVWLIWNIAESWKKEIIILLHIYVNNHVIYNYCKPSDDNNEDSSMTNLINIYLNLREYTNAAVVTSKVIIRPTVNEIINILSSSHIPLHDVGCWDPLSLSGRYECKNSKKNQTDHHINIKDIQRQIYPKIPWNYLICIICFFFFISIDFSITLDKVQSIVNLPLRNN